MEGNTAAGAVFMVTDKNGVGTLKELVKWMSAFSLSCTSRCSVSFFFWPGDCQNCRRRVGCGRASGVVDEGHWAKYHGGCD